MKTARGNDIPGIDAFRQMLQSRSLKATPQRLAIHEAMMKLEHCSAEMVMDYIGKNLDVKITTASVYNTLSQLSDLGIYARRSSPDCRMYYDICNKPHAHLYDARNCEYINISDVELTKTIESHFKRRRFKGYSIDSVDIQVVCHPTKRKKII